MIIRQVELRSRTRGSVSIHLFSRSFLLRLLYNRTYNWPVAYEWNPAKAAENFQKHGVLFAHACSSLEDERALTFEDSPTEDERRWVCLGMDGLGRILTVVYAWRNDKIRLISARRATRRERDQYEGKR